MPEAAGTIAADARKLKQVLLNLLSNDHRGRQRLVIAREDQEAIFNAFRQVGSDGANNARGTGLGLTLARDLVVLHGGTLSVDSAPGKRSVFAVRLPDPSHVA